MRATQDFSPVAPDELVDLSFDFTNYLASGDSVASVSAWRCAVSPTSLEADPSPASRLQGPAVAAGALVTQQVATCLPNVIYVMEALVLTAAGESLSLWAQMPCLPVGEG